MKKALTICMIALFAIGFQAEAQNCNQGKKLAEQTWEKWGPWKPNIQLIPFKNKVKQIKQVWNWIAANGGSTIGPRLLEMDGGNETGSITGQTKRTFVTPPSFEDRVEITINKYDGRARTGVVICTMGRNGVLNEVTDYTFPNDKNGKVKKFTVNNARGKIIMVAMKNLSVGNKFKYRINAKKK